MSNFRPCRALLLATISAAFVGGCDRLKSPGSGAEQRSAATKLAQTKQLNQACGSAQTYDRLKAVAFDDANRLRAARTALLDRVEANTTIRMEDPVATRRDEDLDVTVCRGRLVLDLPPGVEDAFNGERQLKADVEYSVQPAADGSGMVYQMKGGEPIIYRLAALTLPKGVADTRLAAAPPPSPSLPPAPEIAAAPPARRPVAPPRAPGPPERPVAVQPRPPAPTPPPVQVARPVERPAERRPAPVEIADAPRPERAASPSFSCARVSGRVLQTICSDPSLAAQDRRMSSMFYAALARAEPDTRAELRASRDRFLSFRGRCGTPACIARAYDDRMAEIGDIARRD